jgi:RNA polymerase sigma-70 factor (ECF subfamily)
LSPAVTTRQTRTEPAVGFADEEGLLASARLGDPAAFRTLYESHARTVMGNARRLGLPPEEIEDVAQEVFTAAFADIAKVRPGATAGFLFRLTSNRVHDRFRRRRVREGVLRWFGTLPPPAVEGPERVAMRRDAERRVGQILGRMSQKKREVFVLFELQGASGEEIAAVLDVPIDTVWTRLHHARAEFTKIAKTLDLFEEAAMGGRAAR